MNVYSLKILLVGFILALCSNSYLHADLIASWNGEGNGNDGTGNGHHGILNSGSYVAGHNGGQAFSLNGTTSFLSIPDHVDLDGFSQASFVTWVKLNSTSGAMSFFDKRNNFSNDNSFSIGFNYASQLNGNDLGIEVGNPGGNWSNQGSAVSNTLTIDTWHHLAFIYDKDATDNFSIFIDGQLQARTTSANRDGSLFNSTRSLTIGAANNATAGFLDGALDDVAIYNHALSQSEINNLAGVPEPSGFALLATFLVGFAARRRRR